MAGCMSWMFVANLISVRMMSSNLSCGKGRGGILRTGCERENENGKEKRALILSMETPIVVVLGTDK